MNIPFSKPVVLPEHAQLLGEFLNQGLGIGNGPHTKKTEKHLADHYGAPVRLVTSATHALEMMAILAHIKEGDEVICPSFTFVSTANAFALRGAHLRFADNDKYGNLKLDEVERLLSPRTKAVICVDYAGHSVDLDKLREICRHHKIFFLQDSAQSIGSKYKGKPLGSQSDLSCLSFHDTKNIGCGEGGALIINDSSFLERAEIIREKGTNRSRFIQGIVDKYTWVDLGSSYVLSDIHAAFLNPQILQLEKIQAHRSTLWNNYLTELENGLSKKDIRILKAPEYNDSNNHMFAIIFPTKDMRAKFITDMRSQNIATPFHYNGLHKSDFGKKYYQQEKQIVELPNCDQLTDCLVRLPLYFNMNAFEQSFVIEKISHFLRSQ